MRQAERAAARPIAIVDDNPTDCELLTEALRECDPEQPIVTLDSGESALAYLEQMTTGEAPSLLVSDVALPGLSGLDLLAELRKRETTRRLPVVILSGTEEPVLIDRAYELGASSFLIKPDTYPELLEMASVLLRYWVGLNRTARFGPKR